LKTFSHCCRSRTLHCSVSVLMWQNSSNIVTRKRHWWCFVHSGKFLKKLSFEITAIPSSGWILGEEQIGIHSSKFHQPSAYEFADMSSSWGAENDGHENDGPPKLQGIKLQDMKMQDMTSIDSILFKFSFFLYCDADVAAMELCNVIMK